MYVGPFAEIAHQKLYWPPQRLGRAAWSFLSSLRGQIELLRIFSLPAFKSMVLLDPLFPLRHLRREFLLPRFSAKERTASILHHYRILNSRMSSPVPRGVSLLEHQRNGREFSVGFDLPDRNSMMEGEILLQLLVDGTSVYHLQFTIVPGWVLNSEHADVIFVQRLQGVKGCFEQISAATRAFNDVAPPLLLVTVLEGIAAAWGIRGMACVSAKAQKSSKLYNDAHSLALFKAAYDDFFLELGARRISADFFSLPLPLDEKPITLVGNGHKARTRRKRMFRHEIANRVCETMLRRSFSVAS